MNDFHAGKLIVFEGIDGSGKSTVLEKVKSNLKKRNVDVIAVREPGGSFSAEACRELLKSHDLSPLAAFHVMRAASVELHNDVIFPALKCGKVVLSDRCTWASACAYQGSHLGVKFILDSIKADPDPIPEPDLALWFNVSVEESQKRRDVRGEDEDDFADLHKSSGIYKLLDGSGCFHEVDAEQPMDEVYRLCSDLIDLTLTQDQVGFPRIDISGKIVPFLESNSNL